MLVSIIIPIYNLEKYIPKCLDSIINQTYKKLEIILINDNSTDNTHQVLELYSKLDNRILIINNNKNIGVSASRNIGLSIATGEYIQFIDGDDYIPLSRIEIMVNTIIQKKSNIVIAGIHHVYENNQIKEITTFTFKKALKNHIIREIEYGYCFKYMFKKTLCTNIKFNESIFICEDCLFSIDLMLAAKSKISIINEPLYFYMVRHNSATNSPNKFSINSFILSIEPFWNKIIFINTISLQNKKIILQKLIKSRYDVLQWLLNNSNETSIIKNNLKKTYWSTVENFQNYSLYINKYRLLSRLFTIFTSFYIKFKKSSDMLQ